MHANQPDTPLILPRRQLLRRAGSLTLSAAAITLLAGCRGASARVAAIDETQQGADIRLLNQALAAEFQAVAAYQLGADSGLLSRPAQTLAQQFQGHHRAHADLLAATISKLGGQPGEPLRDYAFPVEQLQAEADVLGFAASLERGAVSAYAGAIGGFAERDLATAAASILADEAMHWAVLRQALGQDPVPGAFFA